MRTSKIIEWNGEFIGTAVTLQEAQGWRFVSANHRADGANGRVAATLGEMQAVARRAFLMASPVAEGLQDLAPAPRH